VLEPDSTSRVPSHSGAPPGSELGPHALQILTTEHWSLLSARSLVYTEAMSRTSIFVAALTGAVVSLALVAQASGFGDAFVAFALVLLPVVYFLGVVTVVRLAQVNSEDARWMQGMNRIRHAYLELAPELEPYFVTSRYDDGAGVLQSAMAMRSPPARTQAFVAAPGVVAVVDSVVAGATAAVAGIGLDLGLAATLALGAGFFLLSIASFVLWASRSVPKTSELLDSRFPSPPPVGGV
jgi:hypothetical protein